MKTFKEFLFEKDETEIIKNKILNTNKMFQMAMRAKNKDELQKTMSKMLDNTDLNKINWNSLYTKLNETAI